MIIAELNVLQFKRDEIEIILKLWPNDLLNIKTVNAAEAHLKILRSRVLKLGDARTIVKGIVALDLNH